jgi:hypothetical protein
MDILKYCPFRTKELQQGFCSSDCQLFVMAKNPQEGKCALSALPVIKDALVSLDNTLANSARAIAEK